jgi:hypothetical protein
MTTPKKRSARAPVSREKRGAYGEIKLGVKHLEKSIAGIQKGLRDAERQIEADARARIRALREDARAQLAALKGSRREVARTLGKVSAAAEGSWRQVKQAADAILAEGVNSAASLVERLKKALPR